jgi:hypothetical protein
MTKNKSGIRKRGLPVVTTAVLPVVTTAVFLWSLWGKHENSSRVQR